MRLVGLMGRTQLTHWSHRSYKSHSWHLRSDRPIRLVRSNASHADTPSRPYAHTRYLTATVLRNCLGETPTFFLNSALGYSPPVNPNCRAMSAMDRSVVVRCSFALAIRKRAISSYGDRPNSCWYLRSST